MSKSKSALVLTLAFCALTAPLGAGDVVVPGAIESQGGGFKFPDGTVQASAANDPRTEIDSVLTTISQPGSYFFGGSFTPLNGVGACT